MTAMSGILPPELILEILSWLPVLSLMRFRCVSKTWKFLISDPYLVKLHLERSFRNPHILLLATQGYKNPCFLARLCSLPCLIQNPAPYFCGRTLRCPRPYKYLFGSCNGLLSLHKSLSTKEYEEHWVCFWNPATKICSEPSPRLRLNFGIRDRNCIHFGFAYDDRRDSYKVVAMVLDPSTRQTNVWVYCMGDVCWRLTLMTSPAFLALDSNGYSVNSTVNWIGISFQEPKKPKFFSYDLNNDTCRCLSMPEFASKNSAFPSMGVLNGCLCLSLDIERTIIELFVLKDVRDERSWSLLVSISYETLNISPYSYKLRILGMLGDLLLLAYSNWDAYTILITFNLKENKVERTRTYKKNSLSHIFSCHYIPSLI
ncbi:F-box/kelch-repeat protein At3g23880-like [Vigna radiata var. radiata]|uniref:F-box/kelch-repeat protein At3g23880-like n=1 Tax=Vigna radiata var. radiata TaxID=3916 RepID=A0A1S3TPM3_VIGRR|nr:F-box/kelch-repeat protein At3g23880-like [Vigna radiata var. radiata]